jgi:hypothetical protein
MNGQQSLRGTIPVMHSFKRKLNGIIWLGLFGVLVFFVVVALDHFVIPLGVRFWFEAVFGQVIVLTALAYAALPVIALVVRAFAKFKGDGYKLSLRELFVITAILAAACAVAGYALRETSRSVQQHRAGL